MIGELFVQNLKYKTIKKSDKFLFYFFIVYICMNSIIFTTSQEIQRDNNVFMPSNETSW